MKRRFFDLKPSLSKNNKLGGSANFRTIFVVGFFSGLIFVFFLLYYFFVFSASTEEAVILEEINDSENNYLLKQQIIVTANVLEVIGLRDYITGNGNQYLIIYGNTPSGYVLYEIGTGIVLQSDTMPGDGVIYQKKLSNNKYIINVKY